MPDLKAIRERFPFLRTCNTVYLDSAANAQKPDVVMDAMSAFYTGNYASVHRGVYDISLLATQRYEKARAATARFINAVSPAEIVFTQGATAALNLLAWSLSAGMNQHSNVVVTELEHHANYLPWKAMCKKTGASLRVAKVGEDGFLTADAVTSQMDSHTAVVCVTAASNVLGCVPAIGEITACAHACGALTVIDGAQLVAHHSVDVQALDCDFFCFSAHKLYGPTGIGVLYGKLEQLQMLEPWQLGGGMVDSVGSFEEEDVWQPVPLRFEAGTPPIAEAIGFHAALDFLGEYGMDKIAAMEEELTQYALLETSRIPHVRIIGREHVTVPVFSLSTEGLSSYDLAALLNAYGIAVRCGSHCAQPLMTRLGCMDTLRVSLGVYSTINDVDNFCTRLESIINKYGRHRRAGS